LVLIDLIHAIETVIFRSRAVQYWSCSNMSADTSDHVESPTLVFESGEQYLKECMILPPHSR